MVTTRIMIVTIIVCVCVYVCVCMCVCMCTCVCVCVCERAPVHTRAHLCVLSLNMKKITKKRVKLESNSDALFYHYT